MMTRPYQPPSLLALVAGEDGTAAARLLAEERIRAAALESGRRQGLEEGLRQGRAEGLEEGRAEAEARLRTELAAEGRRGAAAAAAALDALLAGREQDRGQLDADLRAALRGALEAVFPALLARAAGAEVAALLATALAGHAPETVQLRAHPETLAAFAAEAPPGQAHPGRVRLLPDPAMPPGEAEAAWGDGGLVYDPAALMARVLGVLGAPAPADASEAGPAQEKLP